MNLAFLFSLALSHLNSSKVAELSVLTCRPSVVFPLVSKREALLEPFALSVVILSLGLSPLVESVMEIV